MLYSRAKDLLMYFIVKNIHLTTIFITLVLLLLRIALWIKNSPLSQHRFLKIAPHINDTILLATGIWLIYLTQLNPLSDTWLTIKLIAVITYIFLGFVIFRRLKNQRVYLPWLIIMILIYAYIISIALTKSSLGPLTLFWSPI